MTAALLTVRGLFAGYRRELPVVQDLALSVSAGEVVCLLGPNGAGKSTLLKAVVGLAGVFGGSVQLDGREIGGWPTHRIAAAGIGHVPQLANVFTTLTVADNLRAGTHGLPGAAERIKAALARFPELASRLGAYGADLSGGQRQMLAIARMLTRRPALLLLDEPSAGLSPKMAAEVFGHVKRIAEDGVAVLLVEQNVKAGLGIAHRGVVLAAGHVVLEGPAGDIRDNPALGDIFLGNHRRAA